MVQAGKAAPDQPLPQPDIDFSAERPRLGEPGFANHAEPVATPLGEPRRKGAGQAFEGCFHRSPQGGTRVAHLGKLWRKGDVDTNPGNHVFDPAVLGNRAFQENSGNLSAVNQHVVGPLQTSGTGRRHEVAHGKGCHEPEFSSSRCRTLGA